MRFIRSGFRPYDSGGVISINSRTPPRRLWRLRPRTIGVAIIAGFATDRASIRADGIVVGELTAVSSIAQARLQRLFVRCFDHVTRGQRLAESNNEATAEAAAQQLPQLQLTQARAAIDIADTSVYRRTVILEFLDHEMKRLQNFNSGFSILLAKCGRAAMGQSDDDPPAQWLTRLRHCLREVDLIGQLADALYAVILPHTKRRAAEAFGQRITAELGPYSPLTLSTVEIEPRHLAQVLAGLKAPGEP